MVDKKDKPTQPEIVQLPHAIYGRVRLESGFDEEGIKKMMV